MDDDIILNEIAARVIPMIHVFGMYVIINGHLSPGGGFSGASVLGGAMILFALVFGVQQTSQLLNGDLLVLLTSLGPLWYASAGLFGMVRGHEFLANSRAGAPLGEPGALLSAGLIPVIAFGVGVSVAITVVVLYLAIVDGD